MGQIFNVGAVIFQSFVDNSPYLRATIHGRSVRILLDTGSDRNLIARYLLRPQDVFLGQGVNMMGIGGIEPCDKVARFYLASEGVAPIGFYGYVLNQLPNTDVIIGRFDVPVLLKKDSGI